jgi:hypothetical protein
MAESAPDRDSSPFDAAGQPRCRTSLPFHFADLMSPKSDMQWMETIGGGRAPFRISFRVFFRELFFHVLLPFSYIFVKCFISNSDAFLWNRQLIFFGFYEAKARQCGQNFLCDTRWRRGWVFLNELCRMLWTLGMPTAMLMGLIVVMYVQRLDELGIPHLVISYSYYPEFTLLFVMSLIKTFFVSLKWAQFPDSFVDLLRRERVPYDVLVNQQCLAQWSPTLAQTLWSKRTHSRHVFYIDAPPRARCGRISNVHATAPQLSRSLRCTL